MNKQLWLLFILGDVLFRINKKYDCNLFENLILCNSRRGCIWVIMRKRILVLL